VLLQHGLGIAKMVRELVVEHALGKEK
jgi:hypothetical protein